MGTIIKAILGFIVDLLAKLIPTLAKEGKKPQEVKPVGYDKDLEDAIDADIRREALKTVQYKCTSCGFSDILEMASRTTLECPDCQKNTFKRES